MAKEKQLDKRAERLKDYKFWISGFQKAVNRKYNVELLPIDNAAEILNQVYWNLLDTYVRPWVSGRNIPNSSDDPENKLISRFKAISVTELTIISVLPFSIEDEKEEKKWNAKFAFYVAIAILRASCNEDVPGEVYEKVWNFIDDMQGVSHEDTLTFKQEHEKWLELLNTENELPFFSNGQTWRMYYCALKAYWINNSNN